MAAKKRTKRTPKKTTAPDWGPRFLEALADSANISEACKIAKVGRTTVYERRDSDPVFAQAMADALDDAVDALELEARRRALDGCERPVYHQGAQCGTILEYSDTLMIFLLKAHRPDKYRERSEVKHTGQVAVTTSARDLSDDELAAIVRRQEPSPGTEPG